MSVSCPGCGRSLHAGERCTGWIDLENGRIGCQCWVESRVESVQG